MGGDLECAVLDDYFGEASGANGGDAVAPHVQLPQEAISPNCRPRRPKMAPLSSPSPSSSGIHEKGFSLIATDSLDKSAGSVGAALVAGI